MTGRTHDLVAFTALTFVVATQTIPHMSLATAFVAFTANMVGGLTPDIDQSTGALWHRIRFGSIFGKLLAPILGGHRFLSHSVLGIIFFGVLAKFILYLISTVLLVDMNIVWWSFMIGLVSHLIADTFTHEGVPWLFPIPIKFGIPPVKALRFHTGGLIEKGIVFPGFVLLNLYFFYVFHQNILGLLKHSIK